MKIGVVADDFTGASDIALTLAEAGFRVAQFIGVPEGPADAGLGAAVVALKSRTAPVAEAVAASRSACRWLLAQGAEQIVFKVCSTFDSTPNGNIGPVLDALAHDLGAARTIVCPAFPENGRSVYQGHLFVADRLLSESGMQHHPLTPMTDPDLRRVLAVQSARPVGHISAGTVMAGSRRIRAAMEAGTGHLIVDAITNADLIAIGQAAKGETLLCGGSGIAIGLPANFGAVATQPQWQPVRGPAVVLSGSCSSATLAQVESFRRVAPHLEVTVSAVVDGALSAAAVAHWIMQQKSTPLVYSSARPETVRAAQSALGLERSALAIENLFAEVAAILADRGIKRFVVAGGETSGAVVNGLRAAVLDIGPRIAPGVPLVRVCDARNIGLALKSGNFGGRDFFSEALARMEAA